MLYNMNEIDLSKFHVHPIIGGSDFNRATLTGGFRDGQIAFSDIVMFGSVELDGFDEDLSKAIYVF